MGKNRVEISTQKVLKSVYKSISKDLNASRIAVKIALLKNLVKDSNISKIFNRISVD